MKYQTSEKYLLHRIEQMESEIGNLKTDKKNLNEDLSEANKRVTVYCSENGQLKEQIYQMSESGKQADEELAKAAEEVQKSAEQIVDELNKTREERDDWKTKYEEQKILADACGKQLAESRGSVDYWSYNSETYRKDRDNYKTKYENLMCTNQQNVERFSVELREKEAEIEDLKERLHKAQEDKAHSVQGWYDMYREKCNDLDRNTQKCLGCQKGWGDELDKLHKENDDLKKELDYQTRKCKEQEDAVNNSKFAFDVTWADHEKLKQENEDLKTRYDALNALHIALKENYDGAKRNIDELSTQLEEARDELKDTDECYESNKKDLQEVIDLYNELKTKYDALKKQDRSEEAKNVARALVRNVIKADLPLSLSPNGPDFIFLESAFYTGDTAKNILNFISHYARLPQELRELKNKLNEQVK